jgi:hypothetical protein
MSRRSSDAMFLAVTRGPAAAAAQPPDETAFGLLMAWLAEYVPTWGTSVVLHAAVGLLLTFFVWETSAPPPAFVHVGTADIVRPPRDVERRKTDVKEWPEATGRGRNKLQEGNFFFRYTDNPVPGAGDLKTPQFVSVIGVADSRREGGLESLGTDSETVFPRPRDIRGIGTAGNVVYVVDRSGSMTDSIELVKAELKRSIGELEDETAFHVIFYSSGPPSELPTRRLVYATERNKLLAYEFIDAVIAAGGTDPSQAVERAFAVKPDIIYFLTDGEFDRRIVDLVRQRNLGGKVKVYTIGFLYEDPDRLLREIARQNGGQYKFISEADLAAILGG